MLLPHWISNSLLKDICGCSFLPSTFLANSLNALRGLSLLEKEESSPEAMNTQLTTYLKVEYREKKGG